YMAQEWQKRGHEVLIVGASFSHLRKIQPDTAEETIHHVHYRWLKTNRYNGNGIGRIISMFLFIGQLYWQASSFLKNFRPDIVIASSTYPLDIYPAEKIARKYGAKLIYEIHDLWPLSPMELGGYSKNHPFIKVMQRAENMAYQKVDAVVCMLPKAKEHTVEHGLAPEKFHYVPNGVVVSDWDNPDPLP
ncbi:MAG: glycosyltransferase family 4 protein, partial [Bacteroidales bacterium]